MSFRLRITDCHRLLQQLQRGVDVSETVKEGPEVGEDEVLVLDRSGVERQSVAGQAGCGVADDPPVVCSQQVQQPAGPAGGLRGGPDPGPQLSNVLLPVVFSEWKQKLPSDRVIRVFLFTGLTFKARQADISFVKFNVVGFLSIAVWRKPRQGVRRVRVQTDLLVDNFLDFKALVIRGQVDRG